MDLARRIQAKNAGSQKSLFCDPKVSHFRGLLILVNAFDDFRDIVILAEIRGIFHDGVIIVIAEGCLVDFGFNVWDFLIRRRLHWDDLLHDATAARLQHRFRVIGRAAFRADDRVLAQVLEMRIAALAGALGTPFRFAHSATP